MDSSAPSFPAVKMEVKSEPDDYRDAPITINVEPPDPNNIPAAVKIPRKRMPGRIQGPAKRSIPIAVLDVNCRRLNHILRDLVRAHNWKDASGVLSVLLRGPRHHLDPQNFMVALELEKRFGAGAHNYQKVVRQIFDTWRSKVPWMSKSDQKKHSIQLELALFYLTQGSVAEAHNITKFLIEDRDSAMKPTVNLIHGMILYQLWYTENLKEMQRNGFNIKMPPETKGMAIDNDNEGSEMVESSNDDNDNEEFEMVRSSNDHNAFIFEDAKVSSQCDSESSVCYNKNDPVDCKNNVPVRQFNDCLPSNGFIKTESPDLNEERAGSPVLDNNFLDSSIFLAGLDSCRLPTLLKRSTGKLEQSVYLSEQYRDALRHLRLALYSTPPLLAALLPLIQLLLLGDRVEEAFKELEKSCNNLDFALPFRLRARLLEVFHGSHTTMISSCYEDVLKRDPTCNNSLERLIRMHRTGDYSSILLLDMIGLHLDASNGNSIVWEEFASCFLKLVNAASEYEDRMSANVGRSRTTDTISSANKVPLPLSKGDARDVWRLRCRWWMTRHFSNNAYMSESQLGDWKLSSCKAACASHLYGPKFEYVVAVLRRLKKKKEGDVDDLVPFLRIHMQNSMKLYRNVE